MEKLYRIGEVSTIFSIPVRTLHHYDKIGLLKPVKTDFTNSYRYYSQDQLPLINLIKFFKAVGFSLSEIRNLIADRDIESSRLLLKQRLDDVESEISRLQGLKNLLTSYCNNSNPAANESRIYLKEIPPSPAVFWRGRCLWKEEGFHRAFANVAAVLEKKQLQMTGPMMTIFHDPSCSGQDMEACIRIIEGEYRTEEIHTFGGFTAASLLHFGNRQNIEDSYKRLYEWMENNSYRPAGKITEMYLVDGVTAGAEEHYITEILIPIEKN